MLEPLSHLILRVAQEHNLSDPREIATRVYQETPNEDIRDYFSHILVTEVRSVLGAQRSAAMDHALSPRSAKISQRRDWWADMLASRVHVHGEWRRLGDCGREELAFAAAERKAQASYLLKKAGAFTRLLDLITEYGVQTVADLPPEAAPAYLAVVS